MNEKRQLTDASTEMTQMLELTDKDFKVAIMKCFAEQLQTYLKQMEKVSSQKYKI